MLSKYIAIIYEEKTKEIRSIINPTKDEELEDPNFLKNENEVLKMIKLERKNLPEKMSLSDCFNIYNVAEDLIGKK